MDRELRRFLRGRTVPKSTKLVRRIMRVGKVLLRSVRDQGRTILAVRQHRAP
jgi:hypothetical protein